MMPIKVKGSFISFYASLDTLRSTFLLALKALLFKAETCYVLAFWTSVVKVGQFLCLMNASCSFSFVCATSYNDDDDLLTAIGLTPGGSSTVHIYTQTIH
jgi:hypothetical protein